MPELHDISYRPIIASLVCGVLLIWAGLLEISCRSGDKPILPQEPRELSTIRFIYPSKAPMIDPEGLAGYLEQMSSQLTVVYLVSPERDYQIGQLRTLVQLQKRYYRYGLVVLAIDFHQPAHWDQFRRTLTELKANFPASMVRTVQQAELLDVFGLKSVPDDHMIFVLDESAAIGREYQKIPGPVILDRNIRKLLSGK